MVAESSAGSFLPPLATTVTTLVGSLVIALVVA